jgi:hypothetical protein
MVTVDLELPMLRTSERKAFKRCPQQWWWAYREGLVPKRRKSGALWFGTGIHLALEHWYVPGKQRGVDPRETWAKFVGEQIEHVKVEMLSGDAKEGSDVVWMEAGELGEAILANYLKEFGNDEQWEVISPEKTFKVTVPKPGTQTPLVKYVGTFDLVARDLDTGQILLWDHKTAKAIQLGHLPLDDQAGSYWAVASHVLRQEGILKPTESIQGILYNFIMKSPPDDRDEDELGRKRNKPTKQDYVTALVHMYGSGGPAEDEELTDPKYWSKKTIAQLQDVAKLNELTVFGEVSKQQPSKRFVRETVLRTRAERRSQILRIGAEATVMDMFRYGELPIIKNPTKDCQWDCDFRDLCEIDEQGGDTDEFKELVFDVQNPYAAHVLNQREED